MAVVTIGGRRGAALELASPVIIAAGCCGRGFAPQRAWLSGVGALVTHTITPEPRGRTASPSMREATGGLLYRTGLPNRGLERELAEGAARWADLGLPVIVSIAAAEARTLAGMAAEIDAASCAGALELPLADTDDTGDVALDLARRVEAITAVSALPLIVKLSPAQNCQALGRIALAAGADAICVGHGWPAARPATFPNEESEEVLLAGPAILPLTLRLVGELAQAGLGLLVGCGGVASLAAARAYLAAGAGAVQIGSALFHDPELAARIAAELAVAAAAGVLPYRTDLDPRESAGIA